MRSVFGRLASYESRYVGVPLDLEFECDARQFVGVMAALANAGPVLATRTVEIDMAGDGRDTVGVRLTVEGYLLSAPGDSESNGARGGTE